MRWPWPERRRDGPPAGGGRITAHTAPRTGQAGAADPGAAAARPVWLLDVDGVLNARDPGWDGRRASGWAEAGHGRFHITWAPGLVERMRELGQSPAVEIRWATTWVPWIDQIEQLLGLPHWPAAYDGPYEGAGPAVPTPWRKLDAAHAVLEDERRPLIWTDDDAIPTDGDDFERLTIGRPSALLIRPAPHHGLQPDHLHAIEAFLRSGGTRID